ncbi:hypothetical protein [Bradyrhizobium sp.]|uniref:hypothetical protein n=1 Tax=Bradyrhizobium sp. TaxID=376 RepID=UPI003C78904B
MLHDARLTADPDLWRQNGWGRASDSAAAAFLLKKSAGSRKTCGKKATAGVPQREQPSKRWE